MKTDEAVGQDAAQLADKAWSRIGRQKRAGILVPLFSVFSQKSAGIGDIEDIRPLADWCSACGNSILQLLPMNEVGPLFCPYDSLSSFALDPMYIRLEGVDGFDTDEARASVAKLKEAFPAGKRNVDYRIKAEKLKVLRGIFDALPESKKNGFREYADANSYWLEDFALFCYLKKAHNGYAWWQWDKEYRDRDPVALKNIAIEHANDLDFFKWLQWQLFKQFSEARKYALKKGILLKGDLPILVSRDSADVWAHPSYFNLDFVAGAPPDMYCAKGQRWGTPTYKWDAIFSDAGTYLAEKLAYAQNFYDILRIDHVVGLFRIWAIPFNDPEENKGLNGAYDPGDEQQWESHGKRILSFMLAHTSMLLCAEDLGTIPPVCTKTLLEFKIPGNDVQRWIKDWKVKHDFLAPGEYRPLAVSMLSTHDTTNWSAWWENEAGTIDEGLFDRLCAARGIDAAAMKKALFDPNLSAHGRLRWLKDIDSVDRLVSILGQGRDQLWQFIDLYENSYMEKEKLWKQMAMKGAMKEKATRSLVSEVMRANLQTASVFSINLITDILYLFGAISGDPYDYRLNTPGTVGPANWSLVMPLSIEEMQDEKYTSILRKMIKASGR
ncbi:MAG TPA: 4-alpha-glucanotransferase [Candidatus Omnitrophota bacterium]|nr:4-alpha-glucanotransferase [Candidatus Omnitrophota bacterium]